MRRPETSRGFSIIELLVVCLIVAVIVGLIMPALGAGRRTAHRIQCANNLHQIGLALQIYETRIGALPPGVVNPTGPVHNAPDDLHISWTVQLLDDLQQKSVFEAFDTGASVYAPENTTVTRFRIAILHCPSEPTKGPATSYAACHHDVEAPIDTDNHGVFFLNCSLRHADIPDGSAFTILTGEKRVGLRDLGWASGTGATLRNTGTPINGALPRPAPGASDVPVGGFGSYHGGGANVAFGDGSVRFLTERISPRVLRLLGHRDDGELIDEDRF